MLNKVQILEKTIDRVRKVTHPKYLPALKLFALLNMKTMAFYLEILQVFVFKLCGLITLFYIL